MKKAIAFVLALLLTGTLILFSVSFVGRQAVAPATGENAAQVSGTLIREEAEIIRERVTELAGICGFNADPVLAYINEDVLRDLNAQAVRWWNAVLTDGKPGGEIAWDTGELEEVLSLNMLPAGQENETERQKRAATATAEIRRTVIRTVLPARQQVIRTGLSKAESRVDLPNLIRFLMDIPWALLASCALLSGLIALLESRRIREALPWIGGALGAAALVLICLIILFLGAGILPMIREASASLANLYRHAATGITVRAGILAAAFAAGCAACMIPGRRGRKKA